MVTEREGHASSTGPLGRQPCGVTAWRLDVGSDEYVLFEWTTRMEGSFWGRLTPAERDVGRLVEAGLSNAEIAWTRRSSPRTVANQVASIFRKLGISSRLEFFSVVGLGASPPGTGRGRR